MHTFVWGGGQLIEPDIINYLAQSDIRLLDRYDKVRLSLMNLEIERHQIEFEQKRLKDAELPNHSDQKKMVCSVCMVKGISPGVKLLFPKCGHINCEDCTRELLSNPSLHSRCAVCRQAIGSLSDCITVKFKFNAKKDAVCRFCYKPFNDDGKDISLIRCGHAYHAECMLCV